MKVLFSFCHFLCKTFFFWCTKSNMHTSKKLSVVTLQQPLLWEPCVILITTSYNLHLHKKDFHFSAPFPMHQDMVVHYRHNWIQLQTRYTIFIWFVWHILYTIKGYLSFIGNGCLSTVRLCSDVYLYKQFAANAASCLWLWLNLLEPAFVFVGLSCQIW